MVSAAEAVVDSAGLRHKFASARVAAEAADSVAVPGARRTPAVESAAVAVEGIAEAAAGRQVYSSSH